MFTEKFDSIDFDEYFFSLIKLKKKNLNENMAQKQECQKRMSKHIFKTSVNPNLGAGRERG